MSQLYNAEEKGEKVKGEGSKKKRKKNILPDEGQGTESEGRILEANSWLKQGDKMERKPLLILNEFKSPRPDGQETNKRSYRGYY